MDREEGGKFAYRAPAATQAVTCALFRCAPEVELAYTGTLSSQVIVNFDRCVISYNILYSGSGSFDPTSKDYVSPRSSTCSKPSKRPHYSTLGVACWAYSDHGLMAASALMPLEADALTDIAGTGDSVSGCADRADGSDCALPGVALKLGTCVNFECRERCVTSLDCQIGHLNEDTMDAEMMSGGANQGGGASTGGAPTAPGGGSNTSAMCHWGCEKVSGSALGVCARLE